MVVGTTGVGRAVVSLISDGLLNRVTCTVLWVAITAGHESSDDGKRGWLVPRIELVSTTRILLQSRRLKVSQGLPETPMLVQELMNFKAKAPTTSGDTYEAWREGPHDDLVLAVAIAAWVGERVMRRFWTA
jgi:hypothetical protein